MGYGLSLRQPWAELIAQGRKTIEARPWKTKYRGVLYIHASSTIDKDACERFSIAPSSLPRKCLVAVANLDEIITYTTQEQWLSDDKSHLSGFEKFNPPMYGWLLFGIERIEPLPYKGQLGVFRIDVPPGLRIIPRSTD